MNGDSADDAFEQAREAERRLREAANSAAKTSQKLNESADVLHQWREASTWAIDAEVMRRDDPSFAHIGSMIGTVSFDAEKVMEQQRAVERFTGSITSGAMAVGATGTSSILYSLSAKSDSTPPPVVAKLQRTLDTRLREADYEAKLARIDPSLVAVYRQARQQLLILGPDAGRAAIQQVRSLWDNIFNALAPKANVKDYFALADEEDVRRKHRMEFTIEKKVEQVRRPAMKQSIPAHLAAHKRLNRQHKPGPLENDAELENARAALAILHQWIDAIEI